MNVVTRLRRRWPLAFACILTLLAIAPPAALAEPVDVIIWDGARGGDTFSPGLSNPSLWGAIWFGVGYPDNNLNFVEVNELTEQNLGQADLAFLWAFFDGDNPITPLSPDEQGAPRGWVEEGGSVFLALECLASGDSLIGGPFGLYVIGSPALVARWVQAIRPAMPLTRTVTAASIRLTPVSSWHGSGSVRR